MNTIVDDLKSWLENLDVPEPIIKPKTFLGIAKQPHYENVISNIYKFYFRQEEDHGFQDLFVES